ncbi:MAG: bifunctional phosphopantothenoylcysteine decarboxylase/phosphopantothenate--cysteine ligase CoaBC [Bacteroidales bacterium]|jgi:phosphopantothenoylcysteine decarboxylase/phosphopantothenate--cysteine ligase
MNFKGKNVLVTAGPTYEAIDPIRFIGNHSSGKMGFTIAEAFAKAGAKVKLISGPTSLQVKNPKISRTNVISAKQMYDACLKYALQSDIIVMPAAVADFTPLKTSKQKIKKTGKNLVIELVPTKDILAELGKRKKRNQIIIGFALETENEIANAKEKLKNKNLDYIILNSPNDKNSAFGYDTNKITIISKKGEIVKFGLKTKTQAAQEILKVILKK